MLVLEFVWVCVRVRFGSLWMDKPLSLEILSRLCSKPSGHANHFETSLDARSLACNVFGVEHAEVWSSSGVGHEEVCSFSGVEHGKVSSL